MMAGIPDAFWASVRTPNAKGYDRLEFSPTGSLLYVADSSNNVIRVVDLSVSPVTVKTFSGRWLLHCSIGRKIVHTGNVQLLTSSKDVGLSCGLPYQLLHYVIVGSNVCTAWCPPILYPATKASRAQQEMLQGLGGRGDEIRVGK